ncbi:MAG TPA: carboxylate-amine ligase [Ktedonobacteraceae bacterium]|nr:carboxylate-amine ligase [Ktedonobacteraceae bacterium]
MADRFTLGIEEEFQLVNRETGELCACAQGILEKGEPIFNEQIKPEMLQSTVEFVSAILPDIAAARMELYTARALLARLAREEGLALVSAGTHPTASWVEQPRTPQERYIELEEEYQDVGRSILIFGLHVHVAVESKELAIKIMNQVRTWLPHLMALSSNSPFWHGRMTGIKSFRSVVWKRFPRSGMPDVFRNWGHFDRYVQDLVEAECIDNAKKIWWDIRPHPFFDTIEFRMCDMPATIEDTLALAAFCQALVAKLVQLDEHGVAVPILARDYIEENKWRAMRYGLDAEVIDFVQHRRLSMREAVRELLDFVDDVVDELGSRREMNYLRKLLDDARGTGADRQIAVYSENDDIQQVLQFLMEQTMQGVQVDDAALADKFLRFRSQEQLV